MELNAVICFILIAFINYFKVKICLIINLEFRITVASINGRSLGRVFEILEVQINLSYYYYFTDRWHNRSLLNIF
jgi:hypothetical protein